MKFYEAKEDDIKVLFQNSSQAIESIKFYPFNEIEWTIVEIIGRRVYRSRKIVKYKVVTCKAMI